MTLLIHQRRVYDTSILLPAKTKEITRNLQLANCFCKRMASSHAKDCYYAFKIPYIEFYNQKKNAANKFYDPPKINAKKLSDSRLSYAIIILTLQLGIEVFILCDSMESVSKFKNETHYYFKNLKWSGRYIYYSTDYWIFFLNFDLPDGTLPMYGVDHTSLARPIWGFLHRI